MATSDHIANVVLSVATIPFFALIGGMFTESMIMIAVNANRRKVGVFTTMSGWKKLFPPPPGKDDPKPLRVAYRIASGFVTGGLVGIGTMITAIAAVFIFTRGR